MVDVFVRAIGITGLTVGGWLLLVRLGPESVADPMAGCAVSYVYDGDTVALDCGAEAEMTARLVGFDTPETKSPGCAEELAHGALATDRLRALIGIDGEFLRSGHLKLARNDADMASLEAYAQAVADQGLDLELIETYDPLLRQLESELVRTARSHKAAAAQTHNTCMVQSATETAFKPSRHAVEPSATSGADSPHRPRGDLSYTPMYETSPR